MASGSEYVFPGEWEPHAGCWMGFPERPDNWRQLAKPAREIFVAVATAIAEFEPVTVCASRESWPAARALLPAHVRVLEMAQDDSWFRDTAPLFVLSRATGEVRGVDWEFNAWGGHDGGCYASWDNDNMVARKIIDAAGAVRVEGGMVLEGGSIDMDGEGTLITTESCLLNRNRNPHMTKSEIEGRLREMLGIEKVIWLKDGVHLDEDTDGHVDNMCRFVAPGVVVLHWVDDESDPQYASSRDALERLTEATDARGRKLVVHKLHQPGPLFRDRADDLDGLVPDVDGTIPREAGERMPGSYVNFYIANGGVVMMGFGDKERDAAAEAKLAELFPGRRVVVVPGREILLGGGGFHCITQQQPAGWCGAQKGKGDKAEDSLLGSCCGGR